MRTDSCVEYYRSLKMKNENEKCLFSNTQEFFFHNIFIKSFK